MENFLGTGPQVSSILQALITLGSLSWSSRSDNTEKAGRDGCAVKREYTGGGNGVILFSVSIKGQHVTQILSQ